MIKLSIPRGLPVQVPESLSEDPSPRLEVGESRRIDIPVDMISSTLIYHLKDLGSLKNRTIFMVETNFPSLFYWAKPSAIKQLMKHKAH
jgi:hypothetical protein